MNLGSAKIRDPKTKQFNPIAGLIGESAYQTAVRLGTFSGTEKEWNDYIKTEREKALEDIRKAGEDLTKSLPADYVKMTEDVASLKEDKITKPAEVPTVGKILRVKSVNEDGTFICEWADGGSNLDVRIDGESIVRDGVAEIPKADSNTRNLGLIRVNAEKGFAVSADGTLSIIECTDDSLKNRYGRIINGKVIDSAVKVAMCDGKGTAWTADEQAAARERMGIDEWELIADVTLEEDVNSYKVQTQYGYKHIRVFLDNVTDGTNGSFYSYGIIKRTNDSYQDAVCISFNDLSTRYKYGSIDMECVNGNVVLITECSVKTSLDSEVGIYNYPAFKKSWYYADKLFGINFKTARETDQLKKGTKIQVYGVKA